MPKTHAPFIRLVTATLALLLLPALLAADDGLGKQIESLYGGRDAHLLRIPQKDEKLFFDADGQPSQAAHESVWFDYAPVIITKVKVSKHSIHLKGKRLSLIIAEECYDYAYAGDIELEIARRPEADEATTLKTLAAIFIQPDEPWEENTPSETRGKATALASFLRTAAHMTTPPQEKAPAPTPLKDASANKVHPPRPIYDPEPTYSDLARKEKLEGDSTFAITIDAAGHVIRAKMLRSLGLGLNLKALATLHTWRFQPASKDGEPVTATVTVVVSFRLY